MAPTIFRSGKLRVVIYPKDHNPPHVHVISPGGEAKFELKRLTCFYCRGFSVSDIKEIKKALRLRKKVLMEAWRDYEA